MSFLPAINRRAHWIALALALVSASPAALAQTKPAPAALATAKELVSVTGATVLFNPLIAGVIEQAKLLFLQQNPALSKDLNDIANQLRSDLTPRFHEIADEIARLYAVSFNEQELKDILAFYKSPAGQKMLQQQPKVVDGSMKFAQTWANTLSEEVVAKMRDELKKRGHNL
jgi:hypothetical protein